VINFSHALALAIAKQAESNNSLERTNGAAPSFFSVNFHVLSAAALAAQFRRSVSCSREPLVAILADVVIRREHDDPP
jgi:hypothetical protein